MAMMTRPETATPVIQPGAVRVAGPHDQQSHGEHVQRQQQLDA